jgi:hypothetical protein
LFHRGKQLITLEIEATRRFAGTSGLAIHSMLAAGYARILTAIDK